MSSFQISSPILELQTSTVKGFNHEYVTTMIPFENFTTGQVPAQTRENNGLMVMILGIGGLLIFLVVFSFCYCCFRPLTSLEQHLRAVRRARERRERRERENNQRQRIQKDVENPSVCEPILERLNRTEVVENDVENPSVCEPILERLNKTEAADMELLQITADIHRRNSDTESDTVIIPENGKAMSDPNLFSQTSATASPAQERRSQSSRDSSTAVKKEI